MKCPFLHETEVRYCEHAPLRKMIVKSRRETADEKCASAEYTGCAVFRQHAPEAGAGDTCPFLHESPVQFCAAAPVTKFIPSSESLLSRCGSDSHRYCEAYLALAHPERPAGSESRDFDVEGVRIPQDLYYAPNHTWLDVAEDGSCHVGIDGILARALGEVDRITFVTAHGVERPVAILAVHGVGLQIVFPNPFEITSANAYLRAHPQKLTADPYHQGWLFEGIEQSRTPARAGLIPGAESRPWMEREMERISAFAHEVSARQGETLLVANDGGVFAPKLAHRLGVEERVTLFHRFFSPSAGWEKS